MSSFAETAPPTDRPILAIPGPIEVSPAVHAAYSQAPLNHFAEPFISIFSDALVKMRKVWLADQDCQPFILAGSGTMGMEMAVWNLMDPSDRALVCVTGYFGDRFVQMCERFGVATDIITAEIGHPVTETQIREHLTKAKAEGKPCKVVFCTHVDTSTGVRMDCEMVARVAREFDAMSVHDGVCAAAAEQFEFSKWGADVYLTGSQKAVGVPCGLALLMVSPRALQARRDKKGTLPPLYLDFEKWIPIMQGYENKQALYFATPATTLVPAVAVSFQEILTPSVQESFAVHERCARAFRAAFRQLGLKMVPVDESYAAHSMSNVHAPEGLDIVQLLGKARARGVLISGALHPTLKGKSFRIGHMGYMAHQPTWILKVVQVLAEALNDCGYSTQPEAVVAAARAALSQ